MNRDAYESARTVCPSPLNERGIIYRDGYLYQTEANYEVQTAIRPPSRIGNGFVHLSPDGTLSITEGYAWDGPSGPTIHTRNFMPGSLIHDALYQLMRLQFLPLDCRQAADEELRLACLQDGMSSIRAGWVYLAVRLFGQRAASPAGERPLQFAP